MSPEKQRYIEYYTLQPAIKILIRKLDLQGYDVLLPKQKVAIH